MDKKETNQENRHPSNDNTITTTSTLIKEDSPGKPLGAGNNDRLKRDEWSEGAVSSLLEAYETKWVLRNRAKLKGHDWEDVARHVSSRASCTRSPKTQTQCKNKIESMKKRYRSESATADQSSWPLYPRLDILLRGSAPPPPPLATNPPLMLLEPSPVVSLHPPPPPSPPPPSAPLNVGTAENSHGSNGVDRVPKEGGMGTKLFDHVSDKNAMETDSSTPALCSDKEKFRSQNLKTKMEKRKKRKREEWEIADSIRWLAEVLLRSEQTRMETMKEIEKMRAEAEAKRGEMDLKRIEIIAKTQLEIAKLFAGANKGVDPSLRIGRS